jgi:hypothetical protein
LEAGAEDVESFLAAARLVGGTVIVRTMPRSTSRSKMAAATGLRRRDVQAVVERGGT